MVDLEDATRSPPPRRPVRHCARASSSARRVFARVVGDGAREKEWGRQFGGVDGDTALKVASSAVVEVRPTRALVDERGAIRSVDCTYTRGSAMRLTLDRDRDGP